MLRGFLDFVIKDDGFLNPVNMLEEISNHKRMYGKSPVIIINLMCLPTYAEHFEDTLFGGRHQIYQATINDFFQKLIKAGATLEFCLCVKSIDRNSDECKMGKYIQMNSILEEIYKGTSHKEAIRLNDRFLHLRSMKRNLTEIAKQNGCIFKAWNTENFKYKMAEQARKLNAMAVVTDTAGLLFFDLRFKFWYGRDINFKDCTTTEIDRESLLDDLGLRSSLLPILGTFFGGLLRRSSFYVDFFNHFENEFNKIVDFISRCPENLNRAQMQEISKSKVRCAFRETFESSYDYFSLNKEWEEPTDKIERFLYFENTHDNFFIVGGYDSIYDVEFFDFRKKDFDNFIKQRLVIVQRKAGILLQHKNNPNLKHFYYSRKCHLGSLERGFFIPVYPEITVPDLTELLCPSDYPELKDIRFDLLCWTIGDSIQKSTILNLNSKYVVDVLTLYSGRIHEFIKPFEAMVILMTIDTVITGRIPKQMTYPTHLNERAVRLSFVFLALHAEIVDVVHAVGLADKIPTTTRFDGVFYHKLYEEWMDTSEEELSMIFEGYPHLQEILRFLN